MNLDSIISAQEQKPPRIFLYGVEGIGKSTFAASAPSPVFIQTEDGLGSINVPHFPLAQTLSDVEGAIDCLCREEHDFKTVVLDSADWLETLVWDEVNKLDAKELAYGKGQVIACNKVHNILDALNWLRVTKNMTVIITGHAEIKNFASPEVAPFDRYQPKLQARVSALIREWADCVLFANYQISVRETGSGFNSKAQGITSGARYIYTSEKPAYLAKNRYSLPERLTLDWNDFYNALQGNLTKD